MNVKIIQKIKEKTENINDIHEIVTIKSSGKQSPGPG